MKRSLFILSLALSINVVAQNTWDGASTTTTTNGNVLITNGNLNLGQQNTNWSIFVNNTTRSGGVYNYSNYSANSTQYGIYNFNTSTSITGNKYGIYNNLTTQTPYPSWGLYSQIGGTGDGIKYGLHSSVSASGAGAKYGVYTTVSGSNNTGICYGVYSVVSTGTTRYGIYASATGAGARAGYFLGDLETKGTVIVTGNTQGRFAIIPSLSNTTTIAEQSLSIVPNTTSGADDWNMNNSLVLFNDGLMRKSIGSVNKVFSVFRPDLNKDVFRVYGDGKVFSTEVNVMLASTFPDYVFQPSYRLMPLNELKSYIQTNGHLPNIPNAETVAIEGVNLGEMTKVLVEKVEELTLYLLEQQKLLDQQRLISEEQKALHEKQQAEIELLKEQLSTLGK